jgi:hypothetical protein
MSEDKKQTKTSQQKAVENYRRDKTGMQFHLTKEEMELWDRMKDYLELDTHPQLMRWLIDRAVRSIRKQYGRNLLKPPKNKGK